MVILKLTLVENLIFEFSYGKVNYRERGTKTLTILGLVSYG